MKCPYCEKEMTDGAVRSARVFFFTTNTGWGFLSSAPGTDDVILSCHNMTRPIAIAYHCPDCEKVIIDYSIEVD